MALIRNDFGLFIRFLNLFKLKDMFKTKQLPTDRDVLRCIYEMYSPEYPKILGGQVRSENDPYVPININEVAAKLDTLPELIFGRLYFHLNRKYNYKMDSGDSVQLFILDIEDKKRSDVKIDVIQFPFLTSILAGLEEEHSRFSSSKRTSYIFIGIALGSLFVNILSKGF